MNPAAFDRRGFLKRAAFVSALYSVPGAFAEELLRDSAPNGRPFLSGPSSLDTDNDLIIVNDSLTPAAGQITHLSGRILDGRGDPIRNALVEIWQADNNGVYHHSADKHAKPDPNFQGFRTFSNCLLR